MNNLNIVIFGLGYVGMSLAALLGTRHNVRVYDTDVEKMSLVADGKATINDPDIEKYLSNQVTQVNVVTEIDEAVIKSDFCIIATPTNFDIATNYFDTSSVDKCLTEILTIKSDASVIIKSTIPIGFIVEKHEYFKTKNIVFCPEFLQEGTALRDNLNPERIVVGSKSEIGRKIANLFLSVCINNSVPVLLVEPTEAECVKLFANNYLAMRVAFFNELDSFAIHFGLNSEEIINGICGDKRIGNFYNNPSFGFGGYCLPKDVNQLTAEILKIPNFSSPILTAIENSNRARKAYITNKILEENAEIIGIYRINMKAGSHNFRSSAIIDIIMQLRDLNKTVIIYEPLLKTSRIWNCKVVNSYEDFQNLADIIIANRKDDITQRSLKPVISRDIYQNN